jgi:hypothetical protein
VRKKKGSEMTGEETPAPGGGTESKTAPLPFDVSTGHQARMYDYLLGGHFL